MHLNDCLDSMWIQRIFSFKRAYPPQVIRSERYGAPADVYSFGVLVAELLTRRRPFGGGQSLMLSLGGDWRTGLPDTHIDTVALAASPKGRMSLPINRVSQSLKACDPSIFRGIAIFCMKVRVSMMLLPCVHLMLIPFLGLFVPNLLLIDL